MNFLVSIYKRSELHYAKKSWPAIRIHFKKQEKVYNLLFHMPFRDTLSLSQAKACIATFPTFYYSCMRY